MTLIELFSGAGGAALGLKAAGFEGPHLEIDPDAVATLHAAGFASALEADASTLDCSGWESPDLLWASPPCQAFSTAGKRLGALDDRNGWPWTLRIVDQVRPRWVVCENVPGLVQHSGETCGDPNRCPGCYWLRVILPSYRDRFPYVGVWKLNAADYGVPQTRRRVFLVAGPHPVKPPPATHARPDRCGGLFGELQPWESIGKALGLVGTALDRPSPAVVCSEVKGSGPGANPHKLQRASDALFLGTGRRRLTVAECATLQGFPAGYPFQGTKTSQYRQVGNAVPPILAQRIAEAINQAEKEATP